MSEQPEPAAEAARVAPHSAGDDPEALADAYEAILFVAARPVPLDRLAELAGVPLGAAREALEALRRRLEGSGLLLQAVAGGYQLGTHPRHADLVRRFLQREHGERLTRGAMETLAVIAYRQPVTRGDIEAVRGVRSDWHIERLLEHGLIREAGRRATPGRPVLFATTELFLRYFGLNDLAELPPMGERGVQALLDTGR